MQSRYLDCMHADAAERNTTSGNAEIGSEPLAYTVPEAAAALRISERQVWELLRLGRVESIKIGRSRRIPRAGLNAYVESLRGAA
jgi:excisionase family DNA binding protein